MREELGADLFITARNYAIIAVVLGIAFFILKPFTTIAEYERGVITRLGAVSRTATPGLNFKLPLIEGVTVYPVNIQALTIEKVNTYTVDNQQLDAKLIINYRIPADGVESIYRNVPDYEQRLTTMVTDRFKNALGKLNIIDVTQKRADIARSILGDVRDEAKRLFGLEVSDLQIINIQYTQEFESATEQAMTAKAKVEQREQEKRQAQVVAETAKVEAEGKAAAIVAKAEGDAKAQLAVATANAKAIQMEGLAKAEAMRAQSAAVTETLVRMKEAEQWNGSKATQIISALPVAQIEAGKQ